MKRLLIAGILLLPFVVLFLAHRSLQGGLKPGDPLPEARLESMEGLPVETASWRGTPTLLVLFRPGCKACGEEIKGLGTIASGLEGVRIVLVSVNGEPPEEEVPFQVVHDPNGAFLRQAAAPLVPTLYWIDSKGKVRYGRTGVRSPAAELLLSRSLFERRD